MPSIKYTVDVDTKGARSSISSLERSLGGIGGAIAGAFATQSLIGFADQLISLRNRLAAFTSSQAEANAQFNQIAEIAGRSRAGLAETGALYNKMAIAADSMGMSTAQVGRITETFAKSLKVGGANAQESASAILQFSQAMGSGVLRGEEFNAVFEASSSTMLDIAKAMGVPIGQMRKLAEQGKLTSRVISQAVLKMSDDVEGKFAKTIPTIGEAFTNLQTAAGIAFTNMATDGGFGEMIAGIGKNILQLTTDVSGLVSVIEPLTRAIAIGALGWAAYKVAMFSNIAGMRIIGAILTGQVVNLIKSTAARIQETSATAANTTGQVANTAATAANTTTKVANAAAAKASAMAGVANTAATAANTAAQVKNAAATVATGAATAKTAGLMKSLSVILLGPQLANSAGLWGRLKAAILAVGGALGIVGKAAQTGAIAKSAMVDLSKLTGMAKILGVLKNSFTAIRQVVLSVSGSFLKFFAIGIRLTSIVGVVWAIFDVFNSLIKLITGSSLIEWFDRFIKKMFGFSIVDWAARQIDYLWGKIKAFAVALNIMDKSFPGRNRGAKPGSADRNIAEQMTINARKPKEETKTQPGISLASPDRKAASDAAKQLANDQAKSLREVKSAILDITKAYRESSKARLEDLQFQLKSINMSEDQIAVETQRRDIIKEQKTALADLAAKQIEISESEDLSTKGREEALALIAKQKLAIESSSAAELAAADAAIKKIQKRNIALDAGIKKTELLQQANENKAALQALEDQLTLVGLYGDALDDTTAQLELQQKIREINLQYENQLLDLEKQKTKLGKERFANELANLQAVRTEQTQAANDQAAAQKRIDDSKKKSERTDVKGTIGKRLEEIKRSVDPTIIALEQMNNVFDRMGSAIDNFVDTGKFKFADFARSIIADIAKIQLKAAATKILTSVFSSMFGLPGLAAGGPAMAGKPYIVGEQGPELFVPNSAGSIMTNASMNRNEGLGQSTQPVVNNTYITNNINAIDSRSVAQMFVENRKSLLGAATMARKELPYGS
jgi:lambda family phage tail tape measure protein